MNESEVQKLMRLLLRAEQYKADENFREAVAWYRLAATQAHTVASECVSEMDFLMRDAIRTAQEKAQEPKP